MSATEFPPPPSSLLGRARWAFADGMTIVRRDLGHLSSGEFIAQLIFPAFMVIVFGYILGSAMDLPGGGNYREYLLPGLFAMVSFTGAMATATDVASDMGRGVIDRFRSMPMARMAVPFGRTGSDVLVGILVLLGMFLCGLAVGWRPHNGLLEALLALGLLALIRYAASWAGVVLGLLLSEKTLNSMTPVIFPVTMLSNAFAPPDGMPGWLATVAEWNPVSALVTACRQLFGNPAATNGDLPLPLAHPVVATLLWGVILLMAFVPLAVRRYQKLGD